MNQAHPYPTADLRTFILHQNPNLYPVNLPVTYILNNGTNRTRSQSITALNTSAVGF